MPRERVPRRRGKLHAHSASKFSATLNGVAEYGLAGVLDLRATRQSARQSRNLHSLLREHTLDVQGGAFALQRRVGGENYLLYSAASDAFDERVDGEVAGLDSIEWGDVAEKDVVDASDHAGGFELNQVLGLLDDDNLRLVAAWIRADRAGIGFREVVADTAMTDVFLDVADGVGEAQCIILLCLQNVKGDSLGRTRTDAGELLQFGSQTQKGVGDVAGHAGSAVPVCDVLESDEEEDRDYQGDPDELGNDLGLDAHGLAANFLQKEENE